MINHKKLLQITYVLCSLSIIIPGCMIVSRLMEYMAAEDSNQRTANLIADYTISAPGISQMNENILSQELFIDIEGLKTENPDITGYLMIPQTNISYPVMKSEEPDWYINRDFFGNPSVCGSIYLDQASYKGGTNLVLYGHNMKSGQMFGTLSEYLDDTFLQEHKKLYYITGDEIIVYKVCAAFVASSKDQGLLACLIPYTEEEMLQLTEFIGEATSRKYDSIVWGDSLLTLATCEYSQKNGRLFVVGKRTDTIKRGD